MKNISAILSLAAFLLCSCTVDELFDSPVFTASLEEITGTKTYEDSDINMFWNADDHLSVFRSTLNEEYSFDGNTGDNVGTFTRIYSLHSEIGNSNSTNYAVYPYSPAIELTYDGKISLTMPSVQTYAEGSFGQGANTMVAVTAGTSDYFLPFKNLCGYLVVKLFGEDSVKSISLTGNNGEELAGPATVTASYGSDPSLAFEFGATDTITLDCGDGIELGTTSGTATEFWFCIPPVTFSKGFTVCVVNSKDEEMKILTSTSSTVSRNHLVSMAPREATSRKSMPPVAEGYAKTGEYRNYLKEFGYSQADIDKKIAEVYAEIFENEERGAYKDVEVNGKKMGYVCDVKNNDVRSEGMSYGMMVAVQLNKPELFNKIWRWSNYYMRHNENGASHGLFAWQCRKDGSRISQGSASDGELYFVTALLLASRRWGSYEEFVYLSEAQTLLNQLFSKDGTGGVTNIINMDYKLINFCPDVNSNKHTDPSYHLPAFYEIWAETADDGREDLYRELAEKARKYLHTVTDSVTGINPDQSNFDGSPYYGWGWPTHSFHYDSWRVPMNIAMDFSWYHKDAEWQADYATRIVNAVVGKYGLTTFPDQFELNGDLPKGSDIRGGGSWKGNLRHSIGFVGTMATTSLMIDGEYSQALVQHMFEQVLEPYSDGYYDVYYDGLLYLFALLHLSGNYRFNW